MYLAYTEVLKNVYLYKDRGTESGRIIKMTGEMEDSSFQKNNKRYWILFKMVLVTAVILVLGGLLMIPTVFFALPDSAVLQVRFYS